MICFATMSKHEMKKKIVLVTLIGGVVFILFAITSSIWDPNGDLSQPPPPGGNWNLPNLFPPKALHEGLNATVVWIKFT